MPALRDARRETYCLWRSQGISQADAAARAGASGRYPAQIGWQWEQREDVRLRLAELAATPEVQRRLEHARADVLDGSVVTRETILAQAWRLATADLSQYLTVTPDGQIQVELAGLDRSQLSCLASVTQEDGPGGSRRTRITLADRARYLHICAQIVGAYEPQRVEIAAGGEGGVEALSRLRERLRALAERLDSPEVRAVEAEGVVVEAGRPRAPEPLQAMEIPPGDDQEGEGDVE